MSKYLLITGGSKGIGNSIIDTFIKSGWNAINISRSNSQHKNVTNFNFDLSNNNWVEFAEQKLANVFNGKHQICLVHNAAYHINDCIGNQNQLELRKVLEVSIISSASLNNLVIPFMSASSSIIYIGSTLSEIGIANAASYSISKHAIAGMMKATCQDLIKSNIHTCCICPGFTNTDLLTKHLDGTARSLDKIKKRIGAERLIEPEEIAKFVHFCAENPAINGSVLHANLGQIQD